MNYVKSPPSNPTVSLKDIRSISGVVGLRRGVFLSWLRRFTLLASDIAFVSLAWMLTGFMGSSTLSFWDFKTVILVLGISLSFFCAGDLYRSGNSRRNYLGIIKALIFSVLVLSLVTFFNSHDRAISAVFDFQLLFFGGLSVVLVCGGRYTIDQLTHFLRFKGSIRYPAMIIADPEHCDRAIRIVRNEHRYRIASVLDARALDRYRRTETFEHIKRLDIAEVFVAWDAIKNRMFLGQRFQALGITLHVVPVEQDQTFGGANMHALNDQVPCVSFYPAVIAGVDFWLKRSFDIVFALLFLTLTAPIYLTLAIAIRLDSPGPTFYKQTRIGLHGSPFKVWKFRSMVQNADKQQAKLEQLNQTQDGVLFKIKADPRITRVGKFIRRYSLDELPQIFNVLLGEMSLVGPRPLPLRDVEKFKQHYFIRQDVLPGITGLWQVSGRSDIDNFDDVLKLDLHYIQNWSVWLDISILFRTFAAVLKKSGAY